MDWKTMDKYLTKPLIRLRFISKFLRIISPGYSYCSRCHKPWNFTKSKSIEYEHGSGHFAICEKCWNKITIEERIYYYTEGEWSPKTSSGINTITNNIILESGWTLKKWQRKKKLEQLNLLETNNKEKT